MAPAAYGRAYGFERAMDNLGAILGPLLGVALVAWLGVRGAIGASVVPGLLAAAAILVAVRATPVRAASTGSSRLPRLQVRAVARGPLGRVLGVVALFEAGNCAATLLILRATQLLSSDHT